jgi:Putative metallopeptidase
MAVLRAVTLWAAAFAGLLSGSRPALGQDDSARKAVEFAVGNVEFLALHEIAHLLIAEKDIPILGPEENAADYIATLALLREAPLDPAFNDRALARSSVVEHHLDMVGVDGSIPLAPTNLQSARKSARLSAEPARLPRTVLPHRRFPRWSPPAT